MAVTGAILATSSVAISSLLDDFYWFFLFFSIFGGVGSGLILVQVANFIDSFYRIFLLQGNVSVQKYFITKRGIANGIFMSGGALGNMLMPIFLR